VATRDRSASAAQRDARRRAPLGAALALALACACGRGADPAADVSLDVSWDPAPASVGATTFTLTLADAGGAPVEGASVEVEGNMSHAGMVPVLGTADEVGPGRYVVELDLTMGGDWFLLVDAMLPDGRSLERTYDVPGVRSQRELGDG